MKYKEMPSREYLLSKYFYDPETGFLYHKQSHPTNKFKAGDKAGCYVYKRPSIIIDGEKYHLARVIWKMMTGDTPNCIVEHKDRNPHNNNWFNLRLSNHSQNAGNTSQRVNNKIGAKGVCYRPNKSSIKPYFTTLRKDGETYRLGNYATVEEASNAYKVKHIELYGEFSPYYNL